MGAETSKALFGECFPSMGKLGSITNSQPPCSLSIAGTWSGWTPEEMMWSGESFTFHHIVTIGSNGWEAFLILRDGSWEKVIYPSIKKATPAKTYDILGPESQTKDGYTWLMGKPSFNPFKKDRIAPGTSYKVTLHISKQGQVQHVDWELHELAISPVADRWFREQDPQTPFFIAGTWAGWDPKPMLWDGECFSYTVRVGSNGWEAFQLVAKGNWDTVIYPTKNNANPYNCHGFQGPDNKNKGYNWVIGKAGFFQSCDKVTPGTRCRVRFYLDGRGGPKRLAWDLYKGDRADRPTVVCVSGLASGSLEAKDTTQGHGTYRVAWVRVKEMINNPARVFRSLALRLVDATLKDGTPVTTTEAAEGFHVKPVSGLDGIRSLSPPGSIQVPVFGPLIDQLEGDFKWHAFNYDWRRWGDLKYAEEVVDRFRTEVEDAIRADAHPTGQAAVVCHSMGAMVALYILSVIGDSWVRRCISQIILVAPAHMGAPSMVSSFAHCPFLDTQSWLPVPGVFDRSLGDLTATWPCMIAEFPSYVGRAAPWPEDHVFAATPERTYKLAEMGEFLTDLTLCKEHRGFGPALWPGVCKMRDAMRPPLVSTTVIYGAGVDTPMQVEYDSPDLGAQPRLTESAPGDGTIVAASVESVAEHWKRKGAKVRLLREPGSDATSHKGLICSPFTVAMIPRLLNAERLTPISVTIVCAAGLKNADIGPNSLSDPYCIFEIPGKPCTRRQTQIIQDCLDPEWNYTDIIYAYEDGDNLLFTIMDMDTGCTEGDILGKVYLAAQAVRMGYQGTLSLMDEPGSVTVRTERLPDM